MKRAIIVFIVFLFVSEPGRCEAPKPALFTDSEDVLVDPFSVSNSIATVLIFVRPDCPISNRYSPELERIRSRFVGKKIVWWLVYPDGDVSLKSIREHKKEYNLQFPALHDPKHVLVREGMARATPAVAVFVAGKRLVYHGRIDDRYVAFGNARPQPTRRDLQEALDDVVAGRAVRVSSTKAIGCAISPESSTGIENE